MSHYEEEDQVAELKKWWQENWMALAGGLVLGLAGIFGWEAWQSAQAREAEQASHLYSDLAKSIDRPEQAQVMGDRLISEFGGSPYAAQGSLLLAQAAARRQDWAAAEKHLRWVTSNVDDASLRKLAHLRLAQVLWQLQKPDEALAQIEPLPEDDAFAPLYLELRGDIKLSQGDAAAARANYEKAMALGPAAPVRELLQRKLDDLSGAVS